MLHQGTLYIENYTLDYNSLGGCVYIHIIIWSGLEEIIELIL